MSSPPGQYFGPVPLFDRVDKWTAVVVYHVSPIAAVLSTLIKIYAMFVIWWLLPPIWIGLPLAIIITIDFAIRLNHLRRLRRCPCCYPPTFFPSPVVILLIWLSLIHVPLSMSLGVVLPQFLPLLTSQPDNSILGVEPSWAPFHGRLIWLCVALLIGAAVDCLLLLSLVYTTVRHAMAVRAFRRLCLDPHGAWFVAPAHPHRHSQAAVCGGCVSDRVKAVAFDATSPVSQQQGQQPVLHSRAVPARAPGVTPGAAAAGACPLSPLAGPSHARDGPGGGADGFVSPYGTIGVTSPLSTDAIHVNVEPHVLSPTPAVSPPAVAIGPLDPQCRGGWYAALGRVVRRALPARAAKVWDNERLSDVRYYVAHPATPLMLIAIFVVIAILLSVVGDTLRVFSTDVSRPHWNSTVCDGTVEAACMLPLPSAYFQNDSTGRVTFSLSNLPPLRGGARSVVPPALGDLESGWSPTSPIVFALKDAVDEAALPLGGVADMEPLNARILVVGVRTPIPPYVPHNSSALAPVAPPTQAHVEPSDVELVPVRARLRAGGRLVAIYPLVPLRHGHKYVVAIRALTHSGRSIEREVGFDALLREALSPLAIARKAVLLRTTSIPVLTAALGGGVRVVGAAPTPARPAANTTGGTSGGTGGGAATGSTGGGGATPSVTLTPPAPGGGAPPAPIGAPPPEGPDDDADRDAWVGTMHTSTDPADVAAGAAAWAWDNVQLIFSFRTSVPELSAPNKVDAAVRTLAAVAAAARAPLTSEVRQRYKVPLPAAAAGLGAEPAAANRSWLCDAAAPRHDNTVHSARMRGFGMCGMAWGTIRLPLFLAGTRAAPTALSRDGTVAEWGTVPIMYMYPCRNATRVLQFGHSIFLDRSETDSDHIAMHAVPSETMLSYIASSAGADAPLLPRIPADQLDTAIVAAIDWRGLARDRKSVV